MIELVEVIEAVRERGKRFRSDLEKSEALTRYVLIDPLLRALGWSTEDPEKVRPEFSTESGTPDYALLWEGNPLITVEAKALGKKLEGAKDKAFHYAFQNGISFHAATDGLRWEVFDVFEKNPDSRRILAVDLETQLPGAAARALLALWYPAMPRVEAVPSSVFRGPDVRKPVVTVTQRALSLLELEKQMASGQIPRGSKPPQSVRFSDGQEYELKHWKDLLLLTVQWGQNMLANRVPIEWPTTKRTLVAADDIGMRAPRRVGPYWVETHATAFYLVKHALLTLSVLGQDAKKVCITM